MRGSLSRVRVWTGAVLTLVVAAAGASSALATSSSQTANGIAVTASLSPDTVSKGQTVTQTASVKNVSDAVENLRIRIAGPLPTSAPATFSVTLRPSATFSRSASFPAALLKPGSHSLIVAAANTQSNAVTSATASITVQ